MHVQSLYTTPYYTAMLNNNSQLILVFRNILCDVGWFNSAATLCVCVCVSVLFSVIWCVPQSVGVPAVDSWRTSLKLVIVVLKSVRRHPAAQTLPLYLTSGGERENETVRERERGRNWLMKVPLCDVYREKWVGNVEAIAYQKWSSGFIFSDGMKTRICSSHVMTIIVDSH